MLNILLLEDNVQFGDTLKLYLELKGYKVTWCQNLRAAEAELKSAQINLFILDWNLPDGSGLDFLKKLTKSKSTPVFFLTAREEEEAAIQALSEGATDYLRKPFGKEELLLRIKKALNEAHNPKNELRCGNLVLDLKAKTVKYKNKEIQLRKKEFAVLAVLIRYADQVVNREEVLEKIAGEAVFDRTIDTYISRLRKALHDASADEELDLISIYGEGYRLKKKTG